MSPGPLPDLKQALRPMPTYARAVRDCVRSGPGILEDRGAEHGADRAHILRRLLENVDRAR